MGLSGLSGLTGLSSEMGSGLWWLAGGVAKANVFGAYQGKGAGSYAASKSNLNAPGTNDLTETGPPDWAAGVGWQGGAVTQYFTLAGCRPRFESTSLAQFRAIARAHGPNSRASSNVPIDCVIFRNASWAASRASSGRPRKR